MNGAAFVRETRSTPRTGRKGQSNSVLRPREQARMEGERGGSIRLMPVEGVLNPNNCSEIEGEAPLALPVEGATRAPSK
jgi:hypothetical protein